MRYVLHADVRASTARRAWRARGPLANDPRREFSVPSRFDNYSKAENIR
jgi:hypothetical protein|tara:strand:- start:459 stop:605 length:147 start_codon:yes stop_codon:yes gene_type:complete